MKQELNQHQLKQINDKINSIFERIEHFETAVGLKAFRIDGKLQYRVLNYRLLKITKNKLDAANYKARSKMRAEKFYRDRLEEFRTTFPDEII